jgi:hypothetical protein
MFKPQYQKGREGGRKEGRGEGRKGGGKEGREGGRKIDFLHRTSEN